MPTPRQIPRNAFGILLSVTLVLLLWTGASWICGGRLVPSPLRVFRELVTLFVDGATWRHLCLTLFRGSAGLGIAAALAFAVGIPCGLSHGAMAVVSPLVSMVQSCPPIVWISLLLVWASTGAVVPILVVIASAFPPLFSSISHAVVSMDRDLLGMARVYRIPRWCVLRHILLPGVFRHALGAFSFALGVTWKVTATAEFFGADSGVGSRIYWAYRLLDMPLLFGWTLLVILVGLVLEWCLIQPLRGHGRES